MIAMLSCQLSAAVVTWTGTIDSQWGTAGNWDTTAIPPPGSDLVFPANAVALRPNPVNDLGAYALDSITIVGAYTITSSAALTTPTINASATATLAAPLGIPGAGLITIIQQSGTETLTLTGIISGTGGIAVGGPGITQFTGTQANSYTGLTSVATTGNGYLRLARSGVESIPGDLTIVASGSVIIDANSSQIYYASLVTVDGTLDLSLATGLDSGTDNETIGGLAGTGLVILGTRQLGCYISPTIPAFSGAIVGSAASAFRKDGLFVQILSGSSPSFLGSTVLNGSALTILGNQPSSDITATDGTILLAHLASVGAVTMSGTSNLSIGNEPGVENQATSKNLTLASSSRLDVFTGSTAGNSMLSVVGSVTLNGAALTINTDVAPPTAGTIIKIIDNAGTSVPVSGTFASLPEGAHITSSGATPITFSISYVGGDGNDVTLTALSVPASSPAITSASTATGIAGSAFTYAITATNGPTSFAAGNLPPGLTVNAATGAISGTPTFAGVKSVYLSASNAAGSGSGVVTLTISGTGPGPSGGNPPPPGPAAAAPSAGGNDSSRCGLGSTAAMISILLGSILVRQRNRWR